MSDDMVTFFEMLESNIKEHTMNEIIEAHMEFMEELKDEENE